MLVNSCIPVIPSADLEKSLRFWVEGLGLSVDREMRQEGRLVGCMVHNERLHFWLNQRAGSPIKPDNFEGIRLYWTPGDIQALRERLLQLGYSASEIVDRDYGQTEFFVTDDDGYSHCFGVASNKSGQPATMLCTRQGHTNRYSECDVSPCNLTYCAERSHEAMFRPKPNKKNRRKDRRPGHPAKESHPQVRPPVSTGRYDAPGDEPIAIESRLTLQEPFRIDRALVPRLVRRDINPKEAFTIRDASGGYFRASLKELSSDGGLALPYERMERSPEPTVDITLACSVLARQRMIFIMQKATELGVMRIVPLLTDHSVPPEGLEHERANAWPAQVVRAVKQCRRGSLPQVLPPTPLDSFLISPEFTTADICVMLDDQSVPAPAPARPPKRIVLLVGPEGGFSDAERSRLAGKASPWILGGRILRAETAVIVGLTAVQMIWGDFTR